MRLLPFEEVSRRLRVAARSYRGVQVYQLRRDLRAKDASVDFAAAARHARGLHLGYRRKRHHLRDGGTPSPRRHD